MGIAGPSGKKGRGTEADTECLETRPTAKNSWKIRKAVGKERIRRKRLPEKILGRRKKSFLVN